LIRLIIWAVIAWVVIAGIRRIAVGGKRGANRGAAPDATEDMVRCAICRLNVPKSEAIAVAGGWACCPEHARAPAAHP
jgi:uncharacterized protein